MIGNDGEARLEFNNMQRSLDEERGAGKCLNGEGSIKPCSARSATRVYSRDKLTISFDRIKFKMVSFLTCKFRETLMCIKF